MNGPKSNLELINEAREYARMALSLLGILSQRIEHGYDVDKGKEQEEIK